MSLIFGLLLFIIAAGVVGSGVDVFKSQVAFGGGLVLVGHDREKKHFMPRPNSTKTVDIVGRPSPYEPETNYVGIRRLHGDEVQKLEGSRYSPTMQQYEDDVVETFRPTDTLNHENHRNQQESRATADQYADWETPIIVKDRAKESKQERAAFPIMTSPQLYNQCCENLMIDGPKAPTLLKRNRKWRAKRRWQKELPPTINDLPIFTIRVKWKFSPNLPSYSLELVHALLSRHGRITAMTQTSPNSALVVFSDVETSRRALKCSTGVGSANPLLLSWWFPEMCNYDRMLHEQQMREEKRVILQLNESTLLRMEFKKIQEKCMIQIKKYQGGLSYDRNTFVP